MNRCFSHYMDVCAERAGTAFSVFFNQEPENHE